MNQRSKFVNCSIVVILIVVVSTAVLSAPLDGFIGNSEEALEELPQEYGQYPLGGTNRLFYGPLGDWISQSDYFPIEFNVPDAIGNLASSISQTTRNLTARLPALNRFHHFVYPHHWALWRPHAYLRPPRPLIIVPAPWFPWYFRDQAAGHLNGDSVDVNAAVDRVKMINEQMMEYQRMMMRNGIRNEMGDRRLVQGSREKQGQGQGNYVKGIFENNGGDKDKRTTAASNNLGKAGGIIKEIEEGFDDYPVNAIKTQQDFQLNDGPVFSGTGLGDFPPYYP